MIIPRELSRTEARNVAAVVALFVKEHGSHRRAANVLRVSHGTIGNLNRGRAGGVYPRSLKAVVRAALSAQLEPLAVKHGFNGGELAEEDFGDLEKAGVSIARVLERARKGADVMVAIVDQAVEELIHGRLKVPPRAA